MVTKNLTERRQLRRVLTTLLVALLGHGCFTSPNKVDLATHPCQVADDCPAGYVCKYPGRAGGCCNPSDLACGVGLDASQPQLDGSVGRGQQLDGAIDGEIQERDAPLVGEVSTDLRISDTLGPDEEADRAIDAQDAPITVGDEVRRALDAHSTGGSDTSDAASEAPCSAGGSCPVSIPCHKGIWSCSTGTAVCLDDGNATEGTDCGGGNVCHGGKCSACVGGQACPMPGNSCRTGILTCSAGVSTCVDNGPKPDATPCDDTNACTTGEVCHSGVCNGGAQKTCTASDVCHASGTCDPSTGACSNPIGNEGGTCNDGNACTQTDKCQSGQCVGSNSVTCTASDQCHAAGKCDSSTGKCSNPTGNEGLSCTDASTPCLVGKTCTSGVCAGGSAKTCPAPDLCHFAGTCDTSTGTCSNQTKTCTAQDQCHQVGTCTPSTGECTNPVQSDNYPCNDQNGCTTNDVCYQGRCTGGPLVPCSDSQGPCYPPGNCNSTSSSTYTCVYPPPLPDGSTCITGSNQGSCVTYQPTGFVQCLLL